MRRFALLAVVLIGGAASFGLAGCGSLMPSTEVLTSAPAAAAEPQQTEGALNVAASVALGRLLGAPKPISDRMVRILDAASRRADLALLNYSGAQGDYRLEGDLRADPQGNKIRVSYRWRLFDKTGTEIGRIAGAELVNGPLGDPWSEIADAPLQAIAGRGIAMISRAVKTGTPGAPAPVPLAQSSPGAAGRNTPVAVSPAAPGALAPVPLAQSSPGAAGKNTPVAVSPAAQPALPDQQQELVIDTSEALRLVNNYRESKGLLPLTLNNKLVRAAAALAADMAKHNRISHTGPNGADLAIRLKTAGYRFSLAAENIGAGQGTLADLMEVWKSDPSQSRNLLVPDATQMGIAYKYRPDTNYKAYWTLVIAAP